MLRFMAEFLEFLSETWATSEMISIVLQGITLLVTLYALSMIHNKIRLIQGELQALKKDQSVMSDELEFVASTMGGPKAKSAK